MTEVFTRQQLQKKTVQQLKIVCDNLSLSKTGRKVELIERIFKHQNSENSASPTISKRKSSSTELSLKKSKLEFESLDWGQKTGSRYGDLKPILQQHNGNLTIEGPEKLTVAVQSGFWGSSYHQAPSNVVIGSVRITKGKWYFEVTLNSDTQTCIGWCEQSYKPNSNSEGSGGQSWLWDPIQGTRWQGDASSTDIWPKELNELKTRSGETIGVGIDLNSKTIKYWQNGKDLGVCFSGISFNSAKGIVPCVTVSNWGRCTVNFGDKTFAYPQPTYLQLSSPLSPGEAFELYNLFDKYCVLSNLSNDQEIDRQLSSQELGLASSIEIRVSTEQRKVIFGQGFEQYQKDLEIQDEDDPRMLILLWKMNSQNECELTQDEWMAGWISYGAYTIEQMLSISKKWVLEVTRDSKQMHSFYCWLFSYLLEANANTLPIDIAFVIWDLTVAKQDWKFWGQWINFLKETKKGGISKDVWMQLWHFIKNYPDSLESYDDNGFFPTTFDDFVSNILKKDKKGDDDEEEEEY